MYNALGMTRTSAELLLLAALLAGAWMVVGRGTPAPDAGQAGPDRRAVAPTAGVGDALSQRTERLRAFTAAPRARIPVARNPFVFSEPVRPASAQAARHVEVDSEAAAPRPELRLSGIAEEQVDNATVRTAVLSVSGQLVFAKEGDRVLSRFLILKIAPDAIQVKDSERDEVFTVGFK